MLAYVDFDGQLVRWSDPVPSTLPGPSEGVRINRSASIAASDDASVSGRNEDRPRERAVNGKSRENEAEFLSDGEEEEEDTWIDDDDGNAIDENNYGGVKPVPKRLERWDGGNYGRSLLKYFPAIFADTIRFSSRAFESPGSIPARSNSYARQSKIFR